MRMRDIEPRNTFADGLSGDTFSRFGRWQGGKRLEIFFSKSENGRGGSKIADFSVTSFSHGP